MIATLWVIIGAIITALVWSIIKGKKEHRLKFRMKQFGNAIVSTGGAVLCIYIVVLAMAILPTVLKIPGNMLSLLDTPLPDTIFATKGIPLAFIALSVIFVIWFWIKSHQVKLFRYTEEEKGIIEAEDKKVKEKLSRALRFWKRTPRGGRS